MNPPVQEPSRAPLFAAAALILAGNVVRMVGDSIQADVLSLVFFVAGGGAAIVFWLKRK